jgi:hypothetical protein
MPFVILEGVWALAALVALARSRTTARSRETRDNEVP